MFYHITNNDRSVMALARTGSPRRAVREDCYDAGSWGGRGQALSLALLSCVL